jgi:cytosine/adenosine deaminase-related metal-dependent hydrolase
MSRHDGGCELKSLLRGKWAIVGSGGRRRILKDAGVYVEGDAVVDIDVYDVLRAKYRPDFEYGTEHHIIMPGLINGHSHGRGVTTLQRGIRDGPLELWLPQSLVQRNYGINTYHNALLSAINQIENGITCTMHHFYGPVDASDFDNYVTDVCHGIRGNMDAGIRVAFAPRVADQNPYTYTDSIFLRKATPPLKAFFKMKLYSKEEMTMRSSLYFKAVEKLYKKFNGDRAHVLLGPSGIQWCSDDLLNAVKELARKLKTGIHMHMAETRYQMLYCDKYHKGTAVRHLSRLGFLGPEVSLAHAVWLRKEDLKILSKAGSTCVHNPSSNLRLSSGISPLIQMKELKIAVALGIDSTGVNDDEDMFQEMRIVSLLHRLPGLNSRALSSESILDMATIHGAKATGWSSDIGALEVGRKADVILLDSRRIFTPYLSPKLPIIDALVLRGKGIDVDTVMVNGEVLVDNKRYLKCDKQQILDEVKKWPDSDDITDDMLKKLEKALRQTYTRWDKRHSAYRYNNFC